MKTHLSLALLAISVSLLVGCSAGPEPEPEPESFTATGEILVPLERYGTLTAAGFGPLGDLSDLKGGDPCVPDGYDDVSAGAQVSITSSSGETLAFGKLSAPLVSGDNGVRCSLTFTVPDVTVQEKDIYEVSAGTSQRGSLKFTQAELVSGVTLTIG